jgi:hypothetical protein
LNCLCLWLSVVDEHASIAAVDNRVWQEYRK